jgi:uncharacterized protein YjbI with pentapeptide repeats
VANPEHLAKLKEGVDAWNRWRKQNPHVRPWLANADLSGFRLSQANLSWTGLREAKLREAILDRGNFRKADLEGVDASRCSAIRADFSEANLRQVRFEKATLSSSVFTSAQFRKARLVEANFSFATLSGTKISRCSVENTDFANAQLYEVFFIDLDMSSTRGLEMCKHHGPSAIDYRTLRRSSGLPRDFLRGCGLSDWEIAGAEMSRPNLSVQEVTDIGNRLIEARKKKQYVSCFISYSHRDKAFAEKLLGALQGEGIRCWLDEKEIRPGDDIAESIDRALQRGDKVLLCCSVHSLNSYWCDRELAIALEKEERLTKSHSRPTLVIIPLDLDGYLYDEAWRGAYRAENRRRLASDFKNWESSESDFQKKVKDVIRALRIEDDAPTPSKLS